MCTLIDIDSKSINIPITNLFIKFVEREFDIFESLKNREELNVDPFSSNCNKIFLNIIY